MDANKLGSDEDPNDNSEGNKEIVFEIITQLNKIEKKIKEIIIAYISPDRTNFVKDILLNNMVFNLGSKFKVIRTIIAHEKITVNKSFFNSFNIVLNKRNVIAHSDGLILPTEELLYMDYDWNRDGTIETPVFDDIMVPITSMENDIIKEYEIEKIYQDFAKHYAIVDEELDKLYNFISTKSE